MTAIHVFPLFEQADPSFIERYSSTELFTYLESVMERDFEANGPPTDLRLTTKTVQKLLPYDGFYPVNRATQLATLFSQSITPAVTFTGGFENSESGFSATLNLEKTRVPWVHEEA